MSFLKAALHLADLGFHVFPLLPNAKLPLIDDYPHRATRDSELITKWWLDPVMGYEQPYNIGISTTRFGDDGSALIAIDIDNKGTKTGDVSLFNLELQGFECPDTFTRYTPTGGRHLIYLAPFAVKQGVDVLGNGLDIRSRGGYVVGWGSCIQDIAYASNGTAPASAPEWLVEKLNRAPDRPVDLEKLIGDPKKINQARAVTRATEYLLTASPAFEGSGGDLATFAVAARVKDFGVSEGTAFELMLEHWNPRCEPSWDFDTLKSKVHNAYRYGSEPVGAAAPEMEFLDDTPTATPEKLHPFDEMNKEFAFVVAGGGSHILWETTDSKGRALVEHLGLPAFHQKFASLTMDMGEKRKPVTEMWMRSPKRRSYDGICFMPGLNAPERFYNLWRGFAVAPYVAGEDIPQAARDSLTAFLDHALENICQGDQKLFSWLMGYVAHLIQKPWEKPLVALVFKGLKGVGKNAFIERVGHLLGGHFLLASDRRYLVGNFNGHLERTLLMVLDEAFWSGDKQAEGILKSLITGTQHNIEHKGKESYKVDNCTRVVILGNEKWLVPATEDERRFAVFTVGSKKKQNRGYFTRMREGMEAGGYKLLLQFLREYDLSKIDVNDAPSTMGLLEQKISSLRPVEQWWLDSLTDGKIAESSDLSEEWPETIAKETLRSALSNYLRRRGIYKWADSNRALGGMLRVMCPAIDASHRKRDGDHTVGLYKLPSLEQARKEWAKFIGHQDMTWD